MNPVSISEVLLAAFERYHEPRRQRLLAEGLGQVTCSEDEHAHDAENLPCRHCGAAL